MGAPVVIIGASGGVGSALARRLAAAGTPLHLIGRDAGKLETLGAELGAAFSVADATDYAALGAAVEGAAVDGRIAGLVHAVGSIVLKPLRRAEPQDFLDAFSLNALSAAMAVRAAERALKAGEGSVVLFSTIAVAQGFSNHAIVSAAKGAVEGLTRALAADLAPAVRVNAIAPSLMETRMAAPLTQSEAMAKSIAALHPIPRLGSAEDAAALANHLLSRDTGWVTGQVFALDGGRSRLRTRG